MRGTGLPTTTVADYSLGVQAWLGKEPYDPRRVREGGWPNEARSKPPKGFFTSSWIEERQTSAWTDWQPKTIRALEDRFVQLLSPDPDAVLYVIHSPEDYFALVEEYRHPQRSVEPCPDWRILAEDGGFDGVHMTADAVTDQSLWYARAWQVESTLWIWPKLTLLCP